MNEALLATYPPEEALLLACARLHMDEAAVERARAQIARGPDWTRFWDLACRHSVTPLLHRSLPPVAAGCPVPAGVLAQAEHAYSLNALRNALRYDALGALLQALRAANVPVIVLKGAALAERIYGDPALRVFGDVDLLVRSDEDKQRAWTAIRDIKRPFMLELAADHYDLWIDLPGPWATERLPLAEMWAAAEPARIAGVETLVLSPAQEMVMLATNFVRRGFAPLKLLVDIAEMARCHGEALPWEQVAEMSARYGLDRFNWYVLGLARDLLTRLCQTRSWPGPRTSSSVVPPGRRWTTNARTFWTTCRFARC